MDKPTHWRGRKITYGIYPQVHWPQHPMSWKSGSIRIHRIIASESLGRVLTQNEHVHHDDQDRCNWDASNLVLTTPTGHQHLHHPGVDTTCCICGKKLHVSAAKFERWLTVVCSKKCRTVARSKIQWPDDRTLRALVKKTPLTQLGKQLGVSNKAIEKRCALRGIPVRGRGYWASKKTAYTPRPLRQMVHGTPGMYCRGCRCEQCKEYQRRSNAKRSTTRAGRAAKSVSAPSLR
jgi:hypothetical protein